LFKKASIEILKDHFLEIIHQLLANYDKKICDIKISHSLQKIESNIIAQDHDGGFNF